MVLALDGDSTMTSLVPPPPLPLVVALPVRAAFDGAFAVPVPVFVFAVPVLGGTLFPSSHSRRDRPYRTLPVTRRPSAETTSPVRCVPAASPYYAAEFDTAG